MKGRLPAVIFMGGRGETKSTKGGVGPRKKQGPFVLTSRWEGRGNGYR